MNLCSSNRNSDVSREIAAENEEREERNEREENSPPEPDPPSLFSPICDFFLNIFSPTGLVILGFIALVVTIAIIWSRH